MRPAIAADLPVVREELRKIVESEAFKPSPRCRQFLEYVVSHGLAGEHDFLKERVIGSEVFGKEADYDTSSDSIVRVRATEVRRRLSQYYAQNPALHAVRIDIPSGSYMPEILVSEAPAGVAVEGPVEAVLPGEAPAPNVRKLWTPWLAVAVLTVVFAVVALFDPRFTPSPLDEFWAPLLDHPNPPVICLGTPTFHGIKGELARRFAENRQLGGKLASAPVLAPEKDVILYEGLFLGVGGATATGDISNYFGWRKHRVVIRAGIDSTFAEIRNSPLILVGLNYNRWAKDALSDLRFRYDSGAIVDTQDAGRIWKPAGMQPDSRTPEDYAIVTRILHSQSQHPIVVIGGLTTFGTQAAGELLTRPDYFRRLIEKVPKGWSAKNMQLVLHTRVIGITPGPPEILAMHTW
jgi:hypothetical protein